MNKKVFFILILVFVAGLAGGYFYGSKNQKTATSLPCSSDSQDSSAKVSDIDKVNLKLDLLKDYTDFVLLPSEKIIDPLKYADDMGKKAVEIDDKEITAKFYATGEADNKEQKIVDFLDFLNNSIKDDLQ